MQATAGVAGLRPNNPNGYLLGTYRIATAPGGIAGFMAALVAALWAFDGWADLTMLGGEIRRPEPSLRYRPQSRSTSSGAECLRPGRS